MTASLWLSLGGLLAHLCLYDVLRRRQRDELLEPLLPVGGPQDAHEHRDDLRSRSAQQVLLEGEGHENRHLDIVDGVAGYPRMAEVQVIFEDEASDGPDSDVLICRLGEDKGEVVCIIWYLADAVEALRREQR